SKLAENWILSKDTCFLNHGSFGATPFAVLEEQTRLREKIENDPVRFFERDYIPLMSSSIKKLAEFMNADPKGMALVKNTTEGVNTVLRSLVLNPGDEILVTNHSYQACWNAVDFVTERAGAKTVVVEIPFRVENEDEIVDLVMGSVSERTVLAMVDTVTSATGLRMPFERLVKDLQSAGVDVLLDAAHGPGIVPLDLIALDAAYCTGNCHKWLCTPKGSAFLHIRSDRKKFMKPLSISHGASFEGTDQEKFEFEFGWPGTQDPTPWLCIPLAIDFLDSLVEGGWPEIMERNRKLALEGRRILCNALGTTEPVPDSLVSSIASVEMPGEGEVGPMSMEGDPYHNYLLDEFGIQVPVFPWRHHGRRYIRISAQLYNSVEEYEFLAACLEKSM
ncbi:MAG: aminotransferase class V-fold PLP-dependent enzyme, partial [Candidatus Thalassarchaeaceae archaeon]|nr:aminotransferase class V-fold PLP-dependent enzyme [Candidatus Thalassarchaeaceae archaeon]